MSTPPGLLGLVLGFWGWQSGLWPVALPLALALESSRLITVRFDFDFKDFRRVADLSMWILAAVVGYCVFDRGMPHAVVATVELLPIAAMPLMLAQAFSTSNRLDLAALYRLGIDAETEHGAKVHVGYIFFSVCLLSAAAANQRTVWFYPIAIALITWALATARSPRYSLGSWTVLVMVVAGCGYLGQVGLRQAQVALVEATGDWFSGDLTDPYQSSTDIGHIGELKLSDTILVRVTPGVSGETSFLLHRASYDSYASGSWLARKARLMQRTPAASRDSWQFHESDVGAAALTITTQLNRGRAVLPLPGATTRVDGLTVERLDSNRLGTVRVEKDAPYVRFVARHRPGAVVMSPPGENDLKIPRNESAALEGVARALDFEQLDARRIIERIDAYFAGNFSYSIYQQAHDPGTTPVSDFLDRTHTGHCEYFATATVLLLRSAGIPARYSTGYSVQEWSDLEQAYVVRQRHAHAWARYYLDGSWHDLDTTPAIWASVEQEQASTLEPLADLLAWLRFEFNRWRTGGNNVTTSPWWFLALVPLVGYVGWRLRFNRRRRSVAMQRQVELAPGRGIDSEFHSVESWLAERKLQRRPAEPLDAWVERLKSNGCPSATGDALMQVALLHYRYRFDPNADPSHLRDAVSEAVSNWMKDHSDRLLAPSRPG